MARFPMELRLMTQGDKKVIGNTSPRFRFGLDLNASWKGIDVRLFFQGVAKRDAWLNDNMFWGATGGIWQSACFTSHLDFFREEGDDFWSANKDAYFPRILVDNFDKNQKTQNPLSSECRLCTVEEFARSGIPSRPDHTQNRCFQPESLLLGRNIIHPYGIARRIRPGNN